MPEEKKAPFYPASKPFNEDELKVGGYTLPYKEYGNPKGIPIVYLHGGPGAGANPDDARIYDPKSFRIVIFDQRGGGTSTPGGGINDNTPDILADDMEVLRKHLGIEQWHVCAGSWGSALALLYAEKYPDKIRSLTLFGVYLFREQDDHLQLELARTMRPEAFRKYKAFLLPDERDNVKDDVERMLEARYQMLMNSDPAIQDAVVVASERFMGAIGSLVPREGKIAAGDEKRLFNCWRIAASFSRNHRLAPDDRLLKDISKIRHIPTKIIHGWHDMICPPKIADDLKQAFPEAELEMVEAGHSIPDPELVKALAQTTDNIRDTGAPVSKKTSKQSPKKNPGSPRH